MAAGAASYALGVEAGWFGSTLYRKAKKGLKGVVRVASRAYSKAAGAASWVVGRAFNGLGAILPPGLRGPFKAAAGSLKAAINAAGAIQSVATAALSGRNVGAEALKGLKAISAVAGAGAPIAALIPGVGTAGAAALGAVAAVGAGKSLENVALGALRSSMPGGALGKLAFDVGSGLAHGGSVQGVMLAQVRRQIPSAGRTAFDAAVSAGRAGAHGPKARQARGQFGHASIAQAALRNARRYRAAPSWKSLGDRRSAVLRRLKAGMLF